jgi:hypothetical protein
LKIPNLLFNPGKVEQGDEKRTMIEGATRTMEKRAIAKKSFQEDWSMEHESAAVAK